MVCVGLPGPSVLQRLCQLPFIYFNSPNGRSILFPALIVLSLDINNRNIIEESVSMEFFKMYLDKNPHAISPYLRSSFLSK